MTMHLPIMYNSIYVVYALTQSIIIISSSLIRSQWLIRLVVLVAVMISNDTNYTMKRLNHGSKLMKTEGRKTD